MESQLCSGETAFSRCKCGDGHSHDEGHDVRFHACNSGLRLESTEIQSRVRVAFQSPNFGTAQTIAIGIISSSPVRQRYRTSAEAVNGFRPATPLRQSRGKRHDEQTTTIGVIKRIMAEKLNGYRILILETREEAQFSRLLAEQGADVLQCPMFTIHDAPDPAPIEAWIRRVIAAPFDDLVLMTGEGLRRLMKVVRRIGLEQEFVAALAKARKFTRGPKPGRALREIGLEPQMTPEKPTSQGIAGMLARIDLKGPRVRLQGHPA